VLEFGSQRYQVGPTATQANQDILPGQRLLSAPEPLAYHAPGSIAVHGASKESLGYNEAQPRKVEPVWPDPDGNRS